MLDKINMNSVRYLSYLLKEDKSYQLITSDENEIILNLFNLFKKNVKDDNIDDIIAYTLFFSLFDRILNSAEIQDQDNYLKKEDLISISKEKGFIKLFEKSVEIHHNNDFSINNFWINMFSFLEYIKYQNSETKIEFFKKILHRPDIFDIIYFRTLVFENCIDELYIVLKEMNQEQYLIEEANQMVNTVIDSVKRKIRLNALYQGDYYRDLLKYSQINTIKLPIITLLDLFEQASKYNEDQKFLDDFISSLDKNLLIKGIKNNKVKIKRNLNYRDKIKQQNALSCFFDIPVEIIPAKINEYNFYDFSKNDQLFLIKNTVNEDQLDDFLDYIFSEHLYDVESDGLHINENNRELLLLNLKI